MTTEPTSTDDRDEETMQIQYAKWQEISTQLWLDYHHSLTAYDEVYRTRVKNAYVEFWGYPPCE